MTDSACCSPAGCCKLLSIRGTSRDPEPPSTETLCRNKLDSKFNISQPETCRSSTCRPLALQGDGSEWLQKQSRPLNSILRTIQSAEYSLHPLLSSLIIVTFFLHNHLEPPLAQRAFLFPFFSSFRQFSSQRFSSARIAASAEPQPTIV